ncbi:unnamed protein product [Parascedosporium putredinis]|uniref:Uncharacterized protein n=1 Tax=Parascedosporium putredinis TaxID=1442378 RepID=A0A9P1H5N7_9PEZI|nr:unnamed protein product [Parascedosporium putredinis]CAI7998004.1 unnamed protein product [Parascedosporium putredinis]
MKSLITFALAASWPARPSPSVTTTTAICTAHSSAELPQGSPRTRRRHPVGRQRYRDRVRARRRGPFKEEAAKGLEDGLLVVIGETTPEITPEQGAQFFEKKKPKTTSTPEPEPTPEPTPTPSPAVEGPKGLTANFPSGSIPCTQFPSDYGAIPISYLDTNGWAGIQRCPTYRKGDSAISYIETAVKGDGCKTQWPSAQGATLQSIGGLYCNSDGFLELTRPEHPTLCELGAGGVFIQNDLDQVVSTCRTDYPGTESMVIPTVLQPGEKQPLTNPDSSSYYVWNNKATTAQYYVNKKGVSVEDGCLWDSSSNHDERGNWAPINIGTGRSTDGITYLSIFPNSPTTTAKLDFNIKITGDVSIECELRNGVYTNGNANGCTTAIRDGGVAIIRYF